MTLFSAAGKKLSIIALTVAFVGVGVVSVNDSPQAKADASTQTAANASSSSSNFNLTKESVSTAQGGAVNEKQQASYSAPKPEPIKAPGDKRPNIILISSDDQRLSEMRFLPKTTQLLGEQGLTYQNALTPHPLCCPARAEILTGQFAQNNGVRTNFNPQGGYLAYDEEHNIGRWMHEAGYNTAFLGKHINLYSSNYGRDPGWTIFNPTSGGYSDYYDFNQYNDGNPVRVPGYYTDYLGKTAVEYAATLSSYDAPFFMWVSHFAPHSMQPENCDKGGGDCKVPPLLSPSYQKIYEETGRTPMQDEAMKEYQDVVSKASFNEKDVSDKQDEIREMDKFSRAKLEKFVKFRAGALASVDDAVANLVGQLAKDGELENTYILFITDNGYLLGEHRFYGKTMPYEESVRTPLLVRGPGIAAGTKTETVGTHVDLAATFLDISGGKASVTLDGSSMLPTWEGDATFDPHKGGVLIQAGPYKGQTADTGWYYRGVRTGRYTYVEYFDGHKELYDRNRDPWQINSLVKDPAYDKVMVELARRTAALKDCKGAVQCNDPFTGKEPKPRK